MNGTLKSDGTLELDSNPGLPPGPVEVLIRKQTACSVGENWWEFLQRARAELLLQDKTFRSKAEIDADRARQSAVDEEHDISLTDLRLAKCTELTVELLA